MSWQASIDSHAVAVRQIITSAPSLLEWPACRQLMLGSAADTPSWILALPVVSCLAAGGSQKDGVQVAAGWLALNHALHLLDAVEDDDFIPDEIIQSTEKALNFSTALTFAAYSFFSDLSSPGATARVARICSECGYKATQGQHMGFEPGPTRLEDAVVAYWESTILKSGSLFRLACAGGAAAATDDLQVIEALGDYGTPIGVILQVLDDCRDMLDAQTGKREVSLPALLYSAAVGQQEIVHPESRSNLQEAGVPESITGILATWWQRALDSLKPLKPSDATDALKNNLQFFQNASE